MIFVLEDCPFRTEWFNKQGGMVWIDPWLFLEQLTDNQHIVTQVFLDHDLDWWEFNPYKSEITGFDVVKGMVIKNIRKDIEIIIHSMNPSGRERMFNHLSDNGFTNVKIVPFTELSKNKA
jgi:hypothetical protein